MTSSAGTVFAHGFVVSGEGRKMSKSLGNVLDPVQLVKEFPSDSLRQAGGLEEMLLESVSIRQE